MFEHNNTAYDPELFKNDCIADSQLLSCTELTQPSDRCVKNLEPRICQARVGGFVFSKVFAGKISPKTHQCKMFQS